MPRKPSHYSHSPRRIDSDDGPTDTHAHTDGLSNIDINQPSTNEHQHQSHSNADVRNCPICLLQLRSVSVMAVDGCNHGFHNDCISLWKNKTNTCPMCRTPFLFLRNRRRGIDVQCKTCDVSKYVEQQPCAQTNCGLLCGNYSRSVICNTCHRCFHKACVGDSHDDGTSDLILRRHGLTANAFVCQLCRDKCSDCGTTEDADGLLTCDRCTRRYCTCCAEWNPSDANFFCPECLPLMKKRAARRRRRRSARSRNVSRADADADDADGDADGDSANANGDSAADDDEDIQVNDEKADDDDNGDHDRNANEEANGSFCIDPSRLMSLNPVVPHARNASIAPTPPNFSPITNCLRRKQNHGNHNHNQHNHNHNGNHIDRELILLSDDEQDNDQSIKREAACNSVIPPWVQPGNLVTLNMIGGGVLTKIRLVDECFVIVKTVKECAPTRFHNQFYQILRNEIDCLQPVRESRLKLEPIDEDNEDECDHLDLQAPIISNNTDVHRSSHHGRDHVVPYREKNSSNQSQPQLQRFNHEGGNDDNEPFAPALQCRNSKTNATSSKQERDSDDDVDVDDNVDEDIDIDIQMDNSDEESVSEFEAASTTAAATAKRKRTATSKPKPKAKQKKTKSSKSKKQKKKKETYAYVCDDCGYETPERYNLTTHQRIHSGEKPFVCQVCDRAFSQNPSLRRHMLSVHSEERPYLCTRSRCDKAFKRKDSLDLHLRWHSGQKPFACSQCDYKTGNASNLRQHRKIHAREAAAAASASGKKYACETCGQSFAKKRQLDAHESICRLRKTS